MGGGGVGGSGVGNSKPQLKQQCLIHFGNIRGGCEGKALLWSMCCVLGHYSCTLVYKWVTVNLVLAGNNIAMDWHQFRIHF